MYKKKAVRKYILFKIATKISNVILIYLFILGK